MEKDELTLKWGTLKAYCFHTDKARTLLQEYNDIGASVSAMMQNDTKRQKEIICELIDEGNFDRVYLDWTDKYVTKDEAKKYIMDYGN